ncbi:MAG: hypothetical protein KC619_34920, partial [Myxococcales bacterium]|nr:hypothetical protein [Myxococcales bacterium]
MRRAIPALVCLLALTSCGTVAGRRSSLQAASGPRASAPIAAAMAPVDAPLARSLYVGSFAERDAALELAAAHGVSEITLYGLGGALSHETDTLAAFIEAAQARGVGAIAPVSGMDRVESLARFEREHPSARFAGWVTEFEFWNAPGPERAAQFAELQRMLTAMRAAKTDGWVACYLGYP